MKNLIKALFLTLLISQSTLSHAGTYEWNINSNKAAGVTNEMVGAAIDRAIRSTDKKLLGLAKPWRIGVRLSGGTTTNEPTPGYIQITKEKSAGTSGMTIRCQRVDYGTYVNGELLRKLETDVREFVAFLDTADCK